MKKVLYIITLLFIVISCSEAKREAPLMESKTTEMSSEVSPVDRIALEESFAFQYVTQQKLQDYYDLMVLLKQYPEFKEDITLQLKEISKEKITIPDYTQLIRIENLQQLGDIQQVSDSIQKIDLQFDIIDNTNIKKDTITAQIITKKIQLDNTEVVSTKIVFSKEQNNKQ